MPTRSPSAAELAEVMLRRGWLSLIPAELANRVLRASSLRTVIMDNPLYEAGDEPGAVYGLAHGALAITVAPGELGPFLAHFLRPGDWVGAASEITNEARVVTVVAVRRSLVFVLPRRAIEAIAAEAPDFWRYLAYIAVGNLNTAMTAWAELLIIDSHQRLAAVLLRLAGNEPSAPHLVYDIDLSQAQLAETSRLSRNSANLVLRDLEEAGLLERRYNLVRLKDVDGMRRLAGLSSKSQIG